MRSEMMLDIGQETRGFITGGLQHLTVELLQGRCHECIPDTLIAGLSELFQDNEVADRLDCHEAKSTSAGFVWGHSDGFVGHVLGQARSFGLAVVDDGLFHLTVYLLLSSIGGGDKSVQSCQLKQETDQANAASADLNADQMEGQHQSMQK